MLWCIDRASWNNQKGRVPKPGLFFMHMPPDFVVFDCDGVLVDSEPITNRVIRDDLERYGLTMSMDQVMSRFVGGTIKGVMETAREMGANLPDSWVDDIYAKIFAALEAEVTLIPGADHVLDALDRAGIGYAIGSNGPHAKMRITLGRTGLAARLQGRVYSREDVANPKPAPDVYLKAMSDAGFAPSRCVVVEDSASGAKAGRASGAFVCGFAAETDPERLRPHCDVLFDDMAELPGLLKLS